MEKASGGRHWIVSIGHTGNKRCYLDVQVRDAKRRYVRDFDGGDLGEAELDGLTEILRFDEEFDAYAIGPGDAD